MVKPEPMFELPLFPLNTVLFPGMPINLHIFEPRYKLMIETCLEEQTPFGVVLIAEGTPAEGPLAKPHPIGCTAQIVQVERLPDGELDILAVGMERFQTHALDYAKPYLVGMVEYLSLDDADPAILNRARDRLRPWVERYLDVLSQASQEVEFDPQQLPHDPVALAHLAAAVVQIPANQKQSLLAVDQPTALLQDIRTIYRREIALLNMILARDSEPTTTESLFSLN